MENVILEANLREKINKAARSKIRKEGRVPGVYYSKYDESVAFDVDEKDVQIFAHSGQEGYMKITRKNAIIAGVDLKYESIRNADCLVKYNGKDIKIKDLEKDRIIEYGKASVKIVTFLNTS